MLHALNQDILLALYGVAASSPVASGVAVFFAEWFPYLVIASVIVYEFFVVDDERKIPTTLLVAAFPAFATWIIVLATKYVYPMPRPFVDLPSITPLISVSDPFGSFPSAHAAIFGALAGTMFALKSKTAKRLQSWQWYVVAAFIIALARVAVGVHFPIDILAGLSFGLAFGFVLTYRRK